MSEPVFASAAIAVYLLLTVLFAFRLVTRGQGMSKPRLLILAYLAIILHAYTLYMRLFSGEALDISFFTVFSLIAWVIAMMLISFAWHDPIENLALGVLPIAALAVLLRLINDQTYPLSNDLSFVLEIHIITSLIAYSLLSIAALQAILLYVQDVQLHNKHAAGFVRSLPPLETMEKLLFRMIGTGFVILCVSLFSGFFFIDDLISQHKTVLSIGAWILFAVLLVGRWRFGWRGRIAIRWTLTGFAFLLLAYFGSKFVLEIILQRP